MESVGFYLPREVHASAIFIFIVNHSCSSQIYFIGLLQVIAPMLYGAVVDEEPKEHSEAIVEDPEAIVELLIETPEVEKSRNLLSNRQSWLYLIRPAKVLRLFLIQPPKKSKDPGSNLGRIKTLDCL